MDANRNYVEQRLAEISLEANVAPPGMSYWKALQRAAKSEAAREAAARRNNASA